MSFVCEHGGREIDYVPRVAYGEYIRGLLANAARPPVRMDAEAIAIAPVRGGIALELSTGEQRVHAVALAGFLAQRGHAPRPGAAR